MKTSVVTFDCAETLVAVDWQPGRFAVDCAAEAGLDIDRQVAREIYERQLGSRWLEYRQINCTRDHDACDFFWRQMTIDWLAKIGQPASALEPLLAAAERLMYGPDARIFHLFDDVLPVLDALEARGVRVAVISNWDYTLHRVLKTLGIHHRFKRVFASLEEGIEKPEPEFFHIALRTLNVQPQEVLHIGDSPLDDVQGALRVGIRPLLLDRSRSERSDGIIPTLHHVLEEL